MTANQICFNTHGYLDSDWSCHSMTLKWCYLFRFWGFCTHAAEWRITSKLIFLDLACIAPFCERVRIWRITGCECGQVFKCAYLNSTWNFLFFQYEFWKDLHTYKWSCNLCFDEAIKCDGEWVDNWKSQVVLLGWFCFPLACAVQLLFSVDSCNFSCQSLRLIWRSTDLSGIQMESSSK